MSECYCDGEYPHVYNPTIRVAKKIHKCRECKRTIAIGERYEYVFAVYDGDTQVSKTCTRCLDLREYVTAHVPCSCWTHGNMIDDVIEDAEHWSREAPGLLFGALRRRVLINRAPAYRRP